MKSPNLSPAFLVVAFCFLFSFQSHAQCFTTVDWQLTPLPSIDNPDFDVSDTVDICVDVYENISNDWLHGVSISLPIGWELVSANSDVDCGNGAWVFVEDPSLPLLGSGYYFDANNGGTPDGNPFNNWGSSSCSSVTLCFQVRMVEIFAEEQNTADSNSSFAITVVGDSWIIPGWVGPTCDFEEVTHYFDVDMPPLFNGQELTGELQLNASSCVPSSVEIQLLEPGTEVVVETQMAAVNADGAFSTFIDSYGQYDVRLKGTPLLSQKVMAVMLGGGITNLDPIQMAVGDVNGDNHVNLIDVSNLSSGFNLQEGDNYFNASIDLNCDGNINLADISLLSASYGMVGE